ncbi:hypothetical protein [Nocardioides rubriscoriae]|nr:hypothetical protein [Nocardioides rubriscoriae]
MLLEILLAVLAWCVLPLPLAVVVGRAIDDAGRTAQTAALESVDHGV